MSEHLPELRRNHRVRVMGTTAMQAIGLANRRGRVCGTMKRGSTVYAVLDMDDARGLVRIALPTHSLMRCEWMEQPGTEAPAP